MSTHSALEAFFQDQTPLDPVRTRDLTKGIIEGLEAVLYGRSVISDLAQDVRKAVFDDGKFCPDSLGSHPVAPQAMVEIMNHLDIRPILDAVWAKRKMDKIR